MGLEFVFVNEFAVGLEIHETHVFPFLLEQTFTMSYKSLIGDLVLDAQGIEFFDFAAGMHLLDFVLDEMGIVILIDIPASLGALVGEAISGACAALIHEEGVINQSVDAIPVHLADIPSHTVEVLNEAFRHIIVGDRFATLGEQYSLTKQNRDCKNQYLFPF